MPPETLEKSISDPDAALIAAINTGCRESFHQLYQRYVGKVYAHCLRMTADTELAADTSQEVFIQVWLNLNKFKWNSLFTTWLHRITVNTCITAMRKRKSRFRILQPEGDSTAANGYTEQTELHGIDKWIIKLPERARQVFVLHCIEGYRHEEIATLLNTTVGTSKSQYHRARNMLKQWLEADYGTN